ncbi:MAG TPA: hypothetical protein VF666_15405 [Pyrinomonadaceae bacterium]
MVAVVQSMRLPIAQRAENSYIVARNSKARQPPSEITRERPPTGREAHNPDANP